MARPESGKRKPVKILVLAVVLIAVCVVLWVAGVISPRKSIGMQKKVAHLLKSGEAKGRRRASKMGNATGKALKKTRQAANAAARGGRKTRRRAKS